MKDLNNVDKENIHLLVKSAGWRVFKDLFEEESRVLFEEYINWDNSRLEQLEESKRNYKIKKSLLDLAEKISKSYEIEKINLTNDKN